MPLFGLKSLSPKLLKSCRLSQTGVSYVHPAIATQEIPPKSSIGCPDIGLAKYSLCVPDWLGEVVIFVRSQTQEVQIKCIEVSGRIAFISYDSRAFMLDVLPACLNHLGIRVSLLRVK